MELFNKSGIGVASVLLLIGSIIACQSKDEMLPSPAQIEATALTARQGSEASAERRVREWAEQGLPVAQRELGLLYKNRLDRRGDAIAMFEKAARAGDAEAAFQLGELYRVAVAGIQAEPAKALPWYLLAAQDKHSQAAVTVALMLRDGNGVPVDMAGAVKWLKLASEQGNSQAMFLLHNAYKNGEGVPRDAAMSQQWLQTASQRGYPAAVQELATAMPPHDALTPAQDLPATALLKTTIHRSDDSKLLR